jgi:transcriptional regulator with XRE-family HTH domain
MDHEFGTLLKQWRTRRRLSQLDLGLEADVSARHLSYLETGRARPSREMVLHLGEVLDVPRPDRNLMLEAAGFAAAFRARDLTSEDMAAVRDAAQWMIARHQPYPALVLDRHWNLIDLNGPAASLLGAFDLGVGDSLLDAFIASPLVAAIDNWPEMGRHLLRRLRVENARLGGDAVLERAIAALAADAAIAASDPRAALPPFVPTRVRLGETVVSFLSTLAHFSGADDVALAEVSIELMFPADEPTRALLHGLFATA